MNYNNKKFKVISNTENGEVTAETIFHYKQVDNILICSYYNKNIIEGHLLGNVSKEGIITMSYHQINTKRELLTGICTSKPEMLPNGKIRLYEYWQWTNKSRSKGTSILEEI